MSQALVLRWSFGNDKLKKTRTVSFNLPAFKSLDGFRVCPMSGYCGGDDGPCYAQQGRYKLPDAIATRETNLAIVRASLPLFERLALADLARIQAATIRAHDSGDFYSQDYLDAWFHLAAAFPRKRFYCYTKSLHLNWDALPVNFNRVQSFGGQLDHLIDLSKPHARIFATHADRRRAGYVDGNKSDWPAINGTIKIGLVYHGCRELSPRLVQIIRKSQVSA